MAIHKNNGTTEGLWLPILMDEVVGASGFESRASWSRTTAEKEINSLAGLLSIEHRYDMLFCNTDSCRHVPSSRSMPSNDAMQGVGTKLGTGFWPVSSLEIGGRDSYNDFRSRIPKTLGPASAVRGENGIEILVGGF